jgi:hypothetical protein
MTSTPSHHDDALAAYLGDHLAGARTAIELAERCASTGPDDGIGRSLSRFVDEVREDESALRSLAEALDVEPPLTRRAAGLAGMLGVAARDILPDDDPALRRLEDVEALCVGVWGKRLLWSTLLRLDDPRLERFELARLAERADEQERELLRLRELAIGDVFDLPERAVETETIA